MPRHTYNPAWKALLSLLVCAALGWLGCDTVQPAREGTLVLEAYLEAGKPLPLIRVAKTWSAAVQSIPGAGGVPGAQVELVLNGTTVLYVDHPDSIGYYQPESEDLIPVVPPLATFRVTARVNEDVAYASGLIPPLVRLRDVALTIPDEAIEAVFLDSLDIGIDSLNLAVNARQGFIYPVQVDLVWDTPDTDSDDWDDFWIETRLEPKTRFSSSIIDFFLLSRQILREADAHQDPDGRFRWRGVYAVPVETSDTAFPEHDLTVFIVRGNQAFAQFETSRDSPERREPVSNVRGGIGFIGGIALDSLSIKVQ